MDTQALKGLSDVYVTDWPYHRSAPQKSLPWYLPAAPHFAAK